MREQLDRKQPATVTREELYRQVWETPMSRLALQYGITGNGLAKICERLQVPYPPRGYWAKKAAGKNVARYRLPDPEGEVPRNVTINPTPPAPQAPELPAEVREKVEVARSSATAIIVSDRLLRPHPIIANWLAEHDRRKSEARAERDPWRKRLLDPGEWSETDWRRHRILDALFKALVKQGGKPKEGEKRSLHVQMQGESIEIQLREKQKQVRSPAKDGVLGRRQELQPTGRLVFAIKTYLPGNLRREWLESDDAPMETLLADIVATLVEAGSLLVERRRQREEEERQQRIAELQRYEEEQRRKLDNNRWRLFVDLAQQRRDAALARAFLDALKATDIDPTKEIAGRSLADWIAWAEARAAKADPLNHGADMVFKAISEVTAWTYRD